MSVARVEVASPGIRVTASRFVRVLGRIVIAGGALLIEEIACRVVWGESILDHHAALGGSGLAMTAYYAMSFVGGTGGPGKLRVEAGALCIAFGGSERRIPLAKIDEGWTNPARSSVELRLRDGTLVSAVVPRLEEAESLLAAAGLDAGHRGLTWKLGDAVFLDWMAFLLSPIVSLLPAIVLGGRLSGPAVVLGLVGAFLVLRWLFRIAFGPARVTVGTEGVEVKRARGRATVLYGSLASTTFKPRALELRRNDGSLVRARARHLTEVDTEILRARLSAATAAFQERPHN